jgi:molecular chaperone IbpA
MTQLVRFDTNALNRALVGFDQLFNDFEHRFAHQINNNYPPYNIVKTGENDYEIQIAVSGFSKEELTVEVDQDQLIIKGERKRNDDDGYEYLHRGLATRDFTRTWTLADHMVVDNGNIKNGILTVYLKRIIPESLKPRQVKISGE